MQNRWINCDEQQTTLNQDRELTSFETKELEVVLDHICGELVVRLLCSFKNVVCDLMWSVKLFIKRQSDAV